MSPRVISYIRFSSKRQARGRSEERQGDSAQKWCEANGFVLDENLADLGLSAFRGRQRTKGDLAAFLQNIEEGRIPAGSYLLVEHFDRLSREEVSDAQDLVKSILKKGVFIVTLLDGAKYTKESLNNLGALFTMLIMFSRAHEESRIKGERVTDTYTRKRAEGLRPFGAAPGWLKRKKDSKDGEWEVIPELADIVVKVFEHAANGFGGPSIAKLANAEKWPLPTRRTAWSTENWHSKMPAIILKNRAVLGETEHWLRSRKAMEEAQVDAPFKSGKIIKDYYPRIVSDDLWYRARAAVASRKTLPPRRDEHYLNIFSGLLRCGHCGASVQRKAELRGWSRAQLTCTNKMAGVTTCKTASANKTEPAVLTDICMHAGDMLGLGYDKQAAVEEIEVANSKLADVAEKIANLGVAIQQAGPIPEFLEQVQLLSKERSSLEELIESRRQQLTLEPNSMFDTVYADGVLSILHERSDEAKILRADCNLRLRRAISAVWLYAYDVAVVQFKKSPYLLTIKLSPKAVGDLTPAWDASVRGELVLPTLKST